MSGARPEILILGQCILDFEVHTSHQYWERLVSKHPDLRGRLDDIAQTLSSPDEIRRSRRDQEALLFYRLDGPYWLVAVVRRLNEDGFPVTAYRADSIKEGEQLWPK